MAALCALFAACGGRSLTEQGVDAAGATSMTPPPQGSFGGMDAVSNAGTGGAAISGGRSAGGDATGGTATGGDSGAAPGAAGEAGEGGATNPINSYVRFWASTVTDERPLDLTVALFPAVPPTKSPCTVKVVESCAVEVCPKGHRRFELPGGSITLQAVDGAGSATVSWNGSAYGKPTITFLSAPAPNNRLVFVVHNLDSPIDFDFFNMPSPLVLSKLPAGIKEPNIDLVWTGGAPDTTLDLYGDGDARAPGAHAHLECHLPSELGRGRVDHELLQLMASGSSLYPATAKSKLGIIDGVTATFSVLTDLDAPGNSVLIGLQVP